MIDALSLPGDVGNDLVITAGITHPLRQCSLEVLYGIGSSPMEL